MKFLFFIFTHKMGNKQTVTTNEHKAELELYKQRDNMKFYVVKKITVNGVDETFDIIDDCGVLLCFKETTAPGVWKLTDIKKIFVLCKSDILKYITNTYRIDFIENRLHKIFGNDGKYTETITLPVQN